VLSGYRNKGRESTNPGNVLTWRLRLLVAALLRVAVLPGLVELA
jgi:hypothetical protein